MNIREECKTLSRPSIILQFIERCPKSLSKVDVEGNLPIHVLLKNAKSSVEVAVMMMEKYPAALQHQNSYGHLRLRTECKYQCRSFIISKCIELYHAIDVAEWQPEQLAVKDNRDDLPLHLLLENKTSAVEDAITTENYPDVLSHRNRGGDFPLHLKCKNQCRLSIISISIEKDSKLSVCADSANDLPLHVLMRYKLSSVNDTLMIMEKFPEALGHCNREDNFPIRIECNGQCR
jgi:hypothetical protein